MRRSARLGSAAVATVLTVGLAACGDDEKPEETPTKWSAAEATNTSDKDGEKAQDEDFKVVPGTPWKDLELPEGGTSAMVDPRTWPDVQEVLTPEQIKGIVPTQNLARPKLCAFGNYDVENGGQTPKNAQCSWELQGRNTWDNDERLRLTLRGIGADSEVTSAWDDVRTKQRKDAGEDDSFYKDGTYGARRAFLMRDGLGSFVVSDGEIAAWFDVQFPDGDFLVEDNAPENFKEIRTKAFPTMVETFVTFLPREH